MAGEEFGASFSKSATELQRLISELAVMGGKMDGLEVKSGAMSKSFGAHTAKMQQSSKQVYRELVKIGIGADEAAAVSDAAFQKSTSTLLSMAQASTNAAAKADALRHKKSALANQLNRMAKDQEYSKWQQKMAAMYAKTSGETRYLKKRLEELDGAQGKHNATLKATVAAKERAVKADAQQAAKLKELRADYARLNSAQALESETLKLQIKERRRHVQELARERLGLETAAQAQERKAAAEGRSSRVLSKLTSQEARYEARLERANRLTELRNKQLQQQARAAAGLTNAQARQARQMERNIELHQRQARFAALTNAELLGFSRATTRLGREMNASAQAAAIFRAGLGGLGASIGIYTSATIAAAAATYAIAAALRDTVSVGMEFTEMMSRAEAIMMTGVDTMTSAGSSMQSLEMQVRALGQSTIFTATEVSGGLVDLGMAGLSAAESMQALKPALDLASIGGVEVSKSADIATNVMTAFKLEASDLTGVVDILATAVSSSNTNIEQLANALSYVAPAAQAAGFSIKDTTAAIELLSNAGIKSSKAGTGLRRFMLNLQNPTSKGAAVLDKYSIGLQDATGNTRDLIDILGQFNKALHRDGITPSERMAAIVDLVGVRAASAVSRMVSSVDELGVFRRGLDAAAGAADEMRKKIEDNLTGDWDKVKSSFQDLQLEVFQEFQWHLRTTAAELTNFFQKLTVEGDDGISKLDEMIASMYVAKDVIYDLGLAFVAFKGSALLSTFAGAAAANLSALSGRMAILHARTSGATGAQSLLSLSLGRLTTSLSGAWGMTQAYYASMRYATSATEFFAAGANWAAASLYNMAAAARVLLSALSWVGVVWGLYTAIKATFSDTSPYLDSHGNRVNSLKSDYRELGEEMERTQQKKNRLALESQKASDSTELAAIDDQILDIKLVMGNTKSPDLLRVLEDRLFLLQRKAEDLQTSFTDVTSSLNNMATSQEDVASFQDTIDGWTSTLAGAKRKVDELRKTPSSTGIGVNAGLLNQIKSLNELEKVARGYLAFSTWKMGELKEATVSYVETLNEALEAQRSQIEEERRFDQLSVTEKMIETQKALAKAKARVAEMDDQGVNKSLDKYLREQAVVKKLQESLYEYRYEYQDLAYKGAEANKALIKEQKNEEVSLSGLKDQLAALNIERMTMVANSAVTGDPADVERYNEVIRVMIGLTKELNAQEEKNRKARESALESSAEAYKDLLEAQNTEEDNLDSLQTKLTAVTAQRLAMIAAMAVSGEPVSTEAIDALASKTELAARLTNLLTKAQKKAADTFEKAQKKNADAYRELLDLQYEDKRSLQDLKIEMAGLNALRMGMIATAVVSGGAFSTEELNAITKIMEKQAGVLDLIKSKESELQSQRSEAADEASRVREQKLTDAQNLFDDLRGEFDAKGKALAQYKDQLAMLSSLRDATGDASISQDDYNDAVGALAAKFRKNLTEMDPFLSRLKEIRGEYLGFVEETQNQHNDRDWINGNLKGSERDMALGSWEDKRRDTLTSDMPKVEGLSAETGGPGFELNKLNDEDSAQQDWFDKQVERHLWMLETKRINEEEYTSDIKALTAERAMQIEATEEQSHVARMASYAGMFGNLAQLSATFAGDSAVITQSLTAFQQAASLAQTIMAMGTAQAKSFSELGPIAGAAKAAELVAMSASLVSTISSVAAPQAPSFQASTYSGQYDSGGTIPRGSYGIVGEVGPEIVHGPADVTGRQATKRQQEAGGSGKLEFKPVINVTVQSGKDGEKGGEDAKNTGRAVGKQVEAMFMSMVQRELRPKGVLDRAIRQR